METVNLVLRTSGVRPTGVPVAIRHSAAPLTSDAAVKSLNFFLVRMNNENCEEGNVRMFTSAVP